jgi:hypothetical protein
LPFLSQHDCRLVAAAGKWIEPTALAAGARVSTGSADRYVRKLIAIGALETRGGRLRRSVFTGIGCCCTSRLKYASSAPLGSTGNRAVSATKVRMPTQYTSE